MRYLLALLALASGLAFGQSAQLQAFAPVGNTVTFTANISGSIPTPVQASSSVASANQQYVITNTGQNVVHVSWGSTAAIATAACVVPTSTSTTTMPVLNNSQVTLTLAPNEWFCGITSAGTSVVFVTPGTGV